MKNLPAHVTKVAVAVVAAVVAIPAAHQAISDHLTAAGASGAVLAVVDIAWTLAAEKFKAKKASPMAVTPAAPPAPPAK